MKNPRLANYCIIYTAVMIFLFFVKGCHYYIADSTDPNFAENGSLLLFTLIWDMILTGFTVAWILFIGVYEVIKSKK